ncbi:DUF732 domain-containing protein [Mycobacterium sp. IDR2000157661]|uniref:DUF732 domain-containing protein n=1 Tax=Mycobacterium sp. IDR2000157661 TaxID=2867005 RepID=UPI001EEC8962|nr:DUF732 domain-containing protein [Mycobacterium sp. IDR2000157661]
MRHLIGLLITPAIAAAAAAVAVAAPASADQAEFIHKIQSEYVFLTTDQLVSIGQEICAAAASGVPASDTVMMVRDELGMSVSGAGDVVSTAIVELGC